MQYLGDLSDGHVVNHTRQYTTVFFCLCFYERAAMRQVGLSGDTLTLLNSHSKPPRLAIFDGHGIIHRAYYALKDNPLVVKRTGEATSAVFGFTNTLLAVIDDLKPTHI